MSYKVVECCRCKKLYSFNTRFLQRIETEEDKKSEKKVFTVSCSHCGADNKIEI
jgi:hypothetical protein